MSSEYCRFYILAPDEFPEFSHAIILYQTEKPGLVCNQQNTGTSGNSTFCKVPVMIGCLFENQAESV